MIWAGRVSVSIMGILAWWRGGCAARPGMSCAVYVGGRRQLPDGDTIITRSGAASRGQFCRCCIWVVYHAGGCGVNGVVFSGMMDGKGW